MNRYFPLYNINQYIHITISLARMGMCDVIPM